MPTSSLSVSLGPIIPSYNPLQHAHSLQRSTTVAQNDKQEKAHKNTL